MKNTKKIRKTISVEVDETVEADVTLSIHEIVEFIQECDDDEKKDILAALDLPTGIKLSTLDDVMKFDTLVELFHKYSQSELNSFL